MPVAIVKLTDRANQIVNIIKARYNLKDKSEAINKMAEEYEQFILEPELRPEYVKRLKEIEKEDTVKVRDIDEYFETLRKR